jgi:hypothetical protein
VTFETENDSHILRQYDEIATPRQFVVEWRYLRFTLVAAYAAVLVVFWLDFLSTELGRPQGTVQ